MQIAPRSEVTKTRRAVGRVLAGCLALSALGAATPARAEPSSVAATAFREGREALKAGKYELACARFAQSEEAEPSSGARLNLGDCALRQHRYVDAEKLYRGAALLADGEKRTFAEQRAASARALAGTLRLRWIKSKPASGRVEVDDKVVETPADLAMDPGRHVIRVVVGGAEAPQTVEIASGATAEVDLAEPLVTAPRPSPAPGPAPARSLEEAHPAARAGHSPAAYVLFGVSGLALAGGVVTGLVARGARDDLDALCRGVKPCPAEIFARSDAQSSYDEASAFALASTLCFVGAAVSLVAGGTVWLMTAPSPNGPTVSVAGRF